MRVLCKSMSSYIAWCITPSHMHTHACTYSGPAIPAPLFLFQSDKNLEIDVDYYIKNQLHPVVARLLDPIDGTW